MRRPLTNAPGCSRLVAPAALIALTLPATAFASGDLVLVPEVPMLITMVVLFVALIFPVDRLIFKPIFRALDERANRISGARERAAHIDASANSVLAQYEDSIREARAAAEASRKQAIAGARSEQAAMAARARAEAETLVEKARGELSVAIERARTDLRSSTRDLGRAAAQRILGRDL
jgi:F-type H+-transporting ATPase subunit b